MVLAVELETSSCVGGTVKLVHDQRQYILLCILQSWCRCRARRYSSGGHRGCAHGRNNRVEEKEKLRTTRTRFLSTSTGMSSISLIAVGVMTGNSCPWIIGLADMFA